MRLERLGLFALAVALIADKGGDRLTLYVAVAVALFSIIFATLLELGELVEPMAIRWLDRRQARRIREGQSPPMKEIVRTARDNE
jgi:hypothetical protein